MSHRTYLILEFAGDNRALIVELLPRPAVRQARQIRNPLTRPAPAALVKDRPPGSRLSRSLRGHVERWMLRTLAVFGVSKNFAIDGAVVDQDFVDRLRIVELLESTTDWQEPVGIYLLRAPGH